MKIKIDQSVFNMFPNYLRGVVLALDINNSGINDELSNDLKKNEYFIRTSQDFSDYKNHPNIRVWRDAFQSFSFNPNKFPPAISNLVKRIQNGSCIPYINKVVAIMNNVSLQYITPVGGDSIDLISGDLCLGIAQGSEKFIPLGNNSTIEQPKKGEVIYYNTSNYEVFCRAWCWRNSDTTKIMPNTKKVIINIDGLPPLIRDDIEHATTLLASKVEKFCGGITKTFILSKENQQIEFND